MIDDEKTIVSYEAEDSAEEKKNDTMRKVAIGGGIGILLGASAAAVAQTLSSSETPDEDVEVEPAPETVSVASNVSDGMSFGDAFAAARAELGPGGMFTWHGNSYSTYTAEEWDNMSAGERADYGRLVAPHVQFDNGHYGGHHTAHQTVHHVHEHVVHEVADDVAQVEPAETAAAATATATAAAQPAQEEPTAEMTGKSDQVDIDLSKVRLVEAEEVETFDDVDTVVGRGFVDGHDAMFHDLDNNGVFDAATVDANDNHTFIDDQKYDISDLHLSTQNVEAEI
jgi:hypothetical protein